jgi:hypothetical protein
MRTAVLLVALFVIVVGVVGLVAPDSLMAIARYVVTPVGLYVIAALRVAIGFLLVRVAPTTRVPKTLRVVGAVVIVAGLATPLFGIERTRAIMDWEAAQGTNFLRGVALLLVSIGGLGALAVGPKPPSLSPEP